MPYVDNVSLVDLVSGYEHAAGYDIPGRYAGLVLDHFNYGDLTSYLTGRPDSPYWSKLDAISLLGCDCGEVACWPLQADVSASRDLIAWRGFTQPNRPTRDYGSFGPFTFRRTQYDHAARQAAETTAD